MIEVLADQYLYNIRSYLPDAINLRLFNPERGLPSDLESTQGLLIRTVTEITKKSLPHLPDSLEFVGTGSAGTDHVDIDYLTEHGIAFANSAGCNARSVAEYVATVLLIWADQKDRNLNNLPVGIIGVGNVGTQVHRQLNRLDIPTVCYDPPREKRDPDFKSANIQEVLSCPVLTFHTPLSREGEYATFHWLDEEKLSSHSFQLIINSARGGIIDEDELLENLAQGSVKDMIIDVWEDEPNIHDKTAEKAFIKTPHIAGYSVQAKENASKFVAEALLNHFGLTLPEKTTQNKDAVLADDQNINSLSNLLKQIHPVQKYEQRLTDILQNKDAEKGALFNKLRAEFPLRQEFDHTFLPETHFKQFPELAKLGVRRISSD